MLALRFFASGSFMEVIGDTMGYDKSTVSRAVENVTNALLTKKDQYLKWPTQEEIKKIKGELLFAWWVPGCLWVYRCTHVRIQAPSDNEPTYVNRKGLHSINVQAICSHDGVLI